MAFGKNPRQLRKEISALTEQISKIKGDDSGEKVTLHARNMAYYIPKDKMFAGLDAGKIFDGNYVTSLPREKSLANILMAGKDIGIIVCLDKRTDSNFEYTDKNKECDVYNNTGDFHCKFTKGETRDIQLPSGSTIMITKIDFDVEKYTDNWIEVVEEKKQSGKSKEYNSASCDSGSESEDDECDGSEIVRKRESVPYSSRKLIHVYYGVWPDGLACDMSDFIHIIQIVYELQKRYNADESILPGVLFHCLAGMGRSVVTSVAFQYYSSFVKTGACPDILKLVKTARDIRLNGITDTQEPLLARFCIWVNSKMQKE